MPSKLNPLCKRLFLEFSAKNDPRKNDHKHSSLNLIRYPLLSRSFLYSSRSFRPVFNLVITIESSKLIKVSLSDADDLFPYCCYTSLETTFDSFRKMLLLFNPSTLYVYLNSRDLPGEVESIIDSYGGDMGLLNRYHHESLIPLINKWNPKISSVRTYADLFSSKDILPLELNYLCMGYSSNKNELLRVLDRHKIKRLKVDVFSFDGGDHVEVPPKNVEVLKHLDVFHIRSHEPRSFADFIVRNNFKLTELRVGICGSTRYSSYNSILDDIMEIHSQIPEFKERCSNVTEKLYVHAWLRLRPMLIGYFRFDEKWIERLLCQCDLLKDGECKEDYGDHVLTKQSVDGCSTLTLTVRVEVLP